MFFMWIRNAVNAVVIGVGLVAAACGSSGGGSGRPQAPPDAIPGKVSIGGGHLSTGEALGTLRKSTTVAAYSIAKTPITVRQYDRCVTAGACSEPSVKDGACAQSRGVDGATFSRSPSAQDRPVTCVSSKDAAQYCAWVGGRLPRVSEWLLAARGPTVQRYAWGSTPATCDRRHNLSHFAFDCCGRACDADGVGMVGQHPAGDSPLGVSDVLLAGSEIVAADPNSSEPACQPPAPVCLASGVNAGAIDHFLPEPYGGGRSPLPASVVTSFRCAWEGVGQ
jgi:eukaryotic-like serine/threonine-protein kinase